MLKNLIKGKGLTQTDVAVKLGVHQTLVSQWCHGKSNPSIFDAEKLAALLGVSVEEIIRCVKKGEGR